MALRRSVAIAEVQWNLRVLPRKVEEILQERLGSSLGRPPQLLQPAVLGEAQSAITAVNGQILYRLSLGWQYYA